ncbi:uncharacterized protein PG986_008680 [Apiospora aurea]|uniref:Chemotaxis protein CheZ n=1 Tax=Apiospora aurea TaxID=335848 RepID=A0ABR1Q5H7_9PEZI
MSQPTGNQNDGGNLYSFMKQVITDIEALKHMQHVSARSIDAMAKVFDEFQAGISDLEIGLQTNHAETTEQAYYIVQMCHDITLCRGDAAMIALRIANIGKCVEKVYATLAPATVVDESPEIIQLPARVQQMTAQWDGITTETSTNKGASQAQKAPVAPQQAENIYDRVD